MKKTIRILSLILMLCLLVGCAQGTKTYTCENLTMEVPSQMKDITGQEGMEGFTFTLDSTTVAVFGLLESYEDYPALESYELKDYADAVIQVNSLTAEPVQRNGGYYYFTYNGSGDAEDYRYIAGVFKTDTGFWMVQIAASSAKFDQEAFLGYLDTVQFQ